MFSRIKRLFGKETFSATLIRKFQTHYVYLPELTDDESLDIFAVDLVGQDLIDYLTRGRDVFHYTDGDIVFTVPKKCSSLEELCSVVAYGLIGDLVIYVSLVHMDDYIREYIQACVPSNWYRYHLAYDGEVSDFMIMTRGVCSKSWTSAAMKRKCTVWYHKLMASLPTCSLRRKFKEAVRFAMNADVKFWIYMFHDILTMIIGFFISITLVSSILECVYLICSGFSVSLVLWLWLIYLLYPLMVVTLIAGSVSYLIYEATDRLEGRVKYFWNYLADAIVHMVKEDEIPPVELLLQPDNEDPDVCGVMAQHYVDDDE